MAANARIQLRGDLPPRASSRPPIANAPAEAAANPTIEYTAMAVPRLSGGETDLSLRHGKPRHRVEEADHLLALVAEMFGDGECQPRGAAPAWRSLV